ncbi:three-Cys-motif partner protein TcmP [Coraliomargarita sp. SDUM461004]|uniref:Three-Cys-motif partner protein TcmP n=1 Tax=Thalassobacterium sedimentorum TaxID=3041258 RepID=A0ABU1AM48_9BACT|nr:three-Cys-motif partner protein TcmP [Coraliomargarita sp. SDUM461004]MDQ8195787.1 three-Cys-motif partner protein TcmP [Coraliomargarita sp. SDUM461004]
MASKIKDRKHFNQYRDQTRVKHEILRKYMLAFFQILKGHRNNLVYLDGFAGRGTYDDSNGSGEKCDGSPLHALKVIAEKPDLAEKVTTIFVEADAENFKSLSQEIDKFHKAHPAIREPGVHNGTFSDAVDVIISQLEAGGSKLAPTFAFVDPCGIDGASMQSIKKILSYDRCEAFIFFNIEGVRRVCGLEKLSKTLIDLYGSEERSQNLTNEISTLKEPAQKEQAMLSAYMQAIYEEIGSDSFVTFFPIEHEKRKITSHYLIHVTKHSLGYKIMKDVMWKLGVTDEGEGGLGLIQASKYDSNALFRPNWDAFKDRIQEQLNGKPTKISFFYDDCVKMPDDKFSEPAYREALLELESEGRITILDKDAKTPKPAMKRMKRKGKTTLGQSYYAIAVDYT